MKQTLNLSISMNIELPEGDTEITEQEKSAIIDRIHHYLTDIGTTSDTYEGCLAGKIGPLGAEFELTVSEQKPINLAIKLQGGLVQQVNSDQNLGFSVKIFDEDDKRDEGMMLEEAWDEWDELTKGYPYAVY